MKKAVTLTGLMLLAACSPEQAEQQPETVEAASVSYTHLTLQTKA